MPSDVPGEFEGRVALVTGGAGEGIGSTVAARFAAAGATTIVVDHHERRTHATVGELVSLYGEHVFGHVADLGDTGQIEALAEEVTERWGPVAILVNNAARNRQAPTLVMELEEWRRTIDVNLTAPWYLSRLLLPGMADLGGGAIVNMTSLASDTGGWGREDPYAASKAGLNTLTRSLAHAGGPLGVRVNAISMGMIGGTRFVRNLPGSVESALSDTPLRRPVSPENVAEAAAFLASDRAGGITGEVLHVDGGWRLVVGPTWPHRGRAS